MTKRELIDIINEIKELRQDAHDRYDESKARELLSAYDFGCCSAYDNVLHLIESRLFNA